MAEKIIYDAVLDEFVLDHGYGDRISGGENATYRVEIFEEVSSTSGTLTLPTGATISLDQYAEDVDAVCRVITTTGQKPLEQFAEDSSGNIITVALSGTGNADYTLSGTPTGSQYAVCYVIEISEINLRDVDKDKLLIVTLDEAFELLENKVTAFQATPDDIHYPSEALVKSSLDEKLNISDLSANVNLFPTTVASDIGGYYKLVPSIDDPDYDDPAVSISTGAITGADQLISSLASETGLIIGNPGVINVTIIGNIQKVSGISTATFHFHLFHRTAGGVETEIAVSNNTLEVTSASYVEFSATALLNNGSFTATDRLVVKFYGDKVGLATDPVYNFQFGGDTPVRILVPLPLSAIPDPTADEVVMSEIGTATWRTVQDFIQIFGSAGHISGGTITDAGSQTFSVAAGTGFIRTTDSHSGLIRSMDWVASNGRSIADGETRFVYIDYNSGSPQVADTLTRSDINTHDKFELGFLTREGTALHIVNNPDSITNAIAHIIERFKHQAGPQKASGLVLSETGTRNITVTTGEIYDKINEFTFGAIDTSGTDTFDMYRDSVFVSTGNTQWPNTQYDNGSALADLTVNRYGVLWFYIEGDDGDLVMLYGTSNSATIAGAEAEPIPTTLPGRLLYGGFLLGRIIFQKSASTAALIETVSTTMFTTGEAASHANLADLAYADSGHTGFVPAQSGEILGQRETWQTYTATDAGTVTMSYLAGNSHYIDATGMATGETVAINVSNWPTYGTYNGVITVVVATGADIGWTATGDYGALLADIEASKENVTLLSHKKGAATYLYQFVRAD